MSLYRSIMKFLNALLGMCVLAFASHAQSVSQEVIGTAGNEMLSPNVTLSYTIGEPAIGYWNTGGYILTEGFQQNEVIITAINKTTEAVDINVFPNPFSNSFTVQFNNK